MNLQPLCHGCPRGGVRSVSIETRVHSIGAGMLSAEVKVKPCPVLAACLYPHVFFGGTELDLTLQIAQTQ